ncbi:MAG: hypothetical protein OXI13_11225, partial [Gammaproteobacteria bacterium]|nr:hypothetical protein [Gammaproteobacteria bacterium]
VVHIEKTKRIALPVQQISNFARAARIRDLDIAAQASFRILLASPHFGASALFTRSAMLVLSSRSNFPVSQGSLPVPSKLKTSVGPESVISIAILLARILYNLPPVAPSAQPRFRTH